MQQKKQRTGSQRGARKGARTTSSAATEQVSTPATDQSVPVAVSEEAVRTRAYYLYLERGAVPGRELDDWLQAEREVHSLHATA